MKRLYALLPAAALLLAACDAPEDAQPPQAPRPVRVHLVETGSGSNIRQFPGTVRAAREADLSFRVSGVLEEILVREGDPAEVRQVLARLDAGDFRLALQQREATFASARSSFERAQRLLAKQNLSRADYDRLEAEYRNAEAALDLARRELSYTELRAPFEGVVAARLVDSFEEVRASQPILRFQDDSSLDIVFDVPENIIRRIDPTTSEERFAPARSADLGVVARFEGSDRRYPLTIDEAARSADARTQTFRVTMTMPAPTDLQVLPGMTATVEVDTNRLFETGASTWIPSSAVVGDSRLEARVWLLDEATMTVSARRVEVGRLDGDRIEILEGLRSGDRVAVTGAAWLAEGMEVARMADAEQALRRREERDAS